MLIKPWRLPKAAKLDNAAPRRKKVGDHWRRRSMRDRPRELLCKTYFVYRIRIAAYSIVRIAAYYIVLV